MNSCVVLSVDDSNDDNVLLQQAVRKSLATFRLQIVSDGQLAIDYLSGAGPYADRKDFPLPHLLLLDLKMPRKTGFEVLDWLKQQPDFKTLPVAVFSSSQANCDLRAAYEKGSTWFLMKPVNFEDLIQLVSVISQWEISRNPAVLQNLSSYRPMPENLEAFLKSY